jgi:hypothetical protein
MNSRFSPKIARGGLPPHGPPRITALADLLRPVGGDEAGRPDRRLGAGDTQA